MGFDSAICKRRESMRRAKHALAVVAFTLVSCSTSALPASTPTSDSITLRVYATTATIPLIYDLTSHYSEVNPTVTFEIVNGDYQTIFDRMMSDGKGYLLTNHLAEGSGESALPAWPIGQDGIAVIVHPDNPVTGLTSEQLRKIYLGHFTNWNEVGGADAAIVVLSREEGSGTRAEFERLVMGDRLTTQAAQIAPSSAAMIASVASISGSIGYVSMSYLDSSVQSVAIDTVLPTSETVYQNTYPLRVTLFVVGLTEPDDDYRAFIGWIQSPDGQARVGQLYAPVLGR
jgi:phosphate transport system substrate-binding protein